MNEWIKCNSIKYSRWMNETNAIAPSTFDESMNELNAKHQVHEMNL